MKVKSDSLTPTAQVSQWRRLWEKLLVPGERSDEIVNKAQKIETAEDSDQERPQSQTNNTARGDER